MTNGPEHGEEERLRLLSELKLDLQLMAARLDQDEPDVSQYAVLDLLERVDELGVSNLLTPAESVRLSPDNLPAMFEDRAGVAALRDALAIAARLTDTAGTTELRDWWGGTEPQVMLACDDASPSADRFYEFGGRLIHHLSELRNILAVPAPYVPTVDPDALWPPVHSVVTNHAGFQEWTYSWGGQLIWFESSGLGFRVEQRTPIGTDVAQDFNADQIDEAVDVVSDWIEDPPGYSGDFSHQDEFSLAVHEHRALEVVLGAVHEATEEREFPEEERLQLEILTQILQLQMRAPVPDRTIIGRSLRGIATFAGGVLAGVASTYLTSLMIKFGVPPP